MEANSLREVTSSASTGRFATHCGRERLLSEGGGETEDETRHSGKQTHCIKSCSSNEPKKRKKNRTKITGRNQNKTSLERWRLGRRLGGGRAPPAERNGILRSQRRGSAALRIMRQRKLQEVFGVKQRGRAERGREGGGGRGGDDKTANQNQPSARIFRGGRRMSRGVQIVSNVSVELHRSRFFVVFFLCFFLNNLERL